MSDRYNRDDLIPMLVDNGVAATLANWIQQNATEAFMIEAIQMEHSIVLLDRQFRQLLADLKGSGLMPDLATESLPEPIIRPSAPTGIGCAGGNVWVTPPGETYILRFYVNGEHKLTMPNYYITSLESIGAVSSDIVQVCRVVDDIPGWWARIVVP